MNKLTYLTTCLAFALTASPAEADQHRRHGSVCAPRHSSRDLIGADERGTYNASTTSAAVVTCPLPDRTSHKEARYPEDYDPHKAEEPYVTELKTPWVTHVRVWTRDLSSTSPLSCYLYWTEENGFSSWGPTRYTCTTPGGCDTATTADTGAFNLDWTISEDSYWDGIIGAGHYLGVVCTIPPATSAGSSYVKGLRTSDTTEARLYFDGFAMTRYSIFYSWF